MWKLLYLTHVSKPAQKYTQGKRVSHSVHRIDVRAFEGRCRRTALLMLMADDLISTMIRQSVLLPFIDSPEKDRCPRSGAVGNLNKGTAQAYNVLRIVKNWQEYFSQQEQIAKELDLEEDETFFLICSHMKSTVVALCVMTSICR